MEQYFQIFINEKSSVECQPLLTNHCKLYISIDSYGLVVATSQWFETNWIENKHVSCILRSDNDFNV